MRTTFALNLVFFPSFVIHIPFCTFVIIFMLVSIFFLFHSTHVQRKKRSKLTARDSKRKSTAAFSIRTKVCVLNQSKICDFCICNDFVFHCSRYFCLEKFIYPIFIMLYVPLCVCSSISGFILHVYIRLYV